MSRNLRKTALVCCLLLAGLSLAIGQDAAEPWQVQYRSIAPEQVAEEVRQGPLVQLPLSEFKDLLSKAAHTTVKDRAVPALMRSQWKAELIGSSLVGTGLWTVHQPASEPAVLPLATLNVALGQARNLTHPGPAILGEMDGKGPGLLLLQAGMQTIAFHWSARGNLSPIGVHFDVRLPSCPVGSLELDLPRDHVISVPRGAALVSEVKSKDARKRTWQLSLTGHPQIELDIRPLAGSSGLAPLHLTQVAVIQEITPDKVWADFKFQIDVPRFPISELVFDGDPLLTPYKVAVVPTDGKGAEAKSAEILKWRLVETRGLPLSLIVELAQPFHGTLGLQVRCLAPRTADAVWTSPYLRLRQGLARGERLKLLVHPDVPLQKWDAGSFRLLSSDRLAAGDRLLSGDRAREGMLMLSLEDPRTVDARTTFQQQRPSFLGKAQGLDVHTRQQTWWHVGAQGMTLEADITFETARGSLYQLLVGLPRTGAAWRVEKAEVVAAPDMVQSRTSTDRLLTIDLRSPVTPRHPVKLRLELRSPSDNLGRPGGTLLDFPDLEPWHGGSREGTLHISVDPIFQASVVQHSVPAVSADVDGPSGMPPLFSFQYRDPLAPRTGGAMSTAPALTGKLRLLPSSDRLQATTRSKVLLAAGRANVQTRLELEPLMGSLEQCDFMAAHGGQTVWQARMEKGSGRTLRPPQRLPLEESLPYMLGLGQASPLGWLPLMPAVDDLRMWRLRFEPPLSHRETILLEAGCARVGGQGWDVPLISVLDTPRRQGEVLLEPSGTSLGQVLAHGLVLPGGQLKKTPLEMRRLPVESAQLPMLRLQAPPAEAVRHRQEHIDHARLQSYLLDDGRVFHHLSFQAANWAGKDVPVILPDGARVLAARVAGIWQDDVILQKADAGLEIRVPVPAGLARKGDVRGPQSGADLWQIDVYYSGEPVGATWSNWARVAAPWPILPTPPLTRQRTWYLPGDQVPLRQDRWRDPLFPVRPASAGQQLIRQAWQLGDPLLDFVTARPADDNRQLRNAENDLRRQWKNGLTLGEALQRLVFEHLRDRALVVVDAAGLAAAGLTPGTPIKLPLPAEQPFWENVGLATLSCPSGVVLTTRRQLQNWQGTVSPRALDAAVLQALTDGCDRHGDFRTVAVWLSSAASERAADFSLSSEGESIPSRTMTDFPGLFSEQAPLGFTAWQPRSSEEDEAEIDVVSTTQIRRLGWILGLAALLLTFRSWRAFSGVVFFRLLLLWSTAWGLAFLWLPVSLQAVALGPLLGSWAWSLLGYILVLGRAVPRLARRGLSTKTRSRSRSSSVGSSGLTVLLILCLPLWSQNPAAPPGPRTVVRVVAGPADAPDKAMALVNPEFLNRLRAHVTPQSAAILIDAHYKGEVKGNLVSFQGEFDFFCPGENSELVLPLTSVAANDLALKEGATLQALDEAGLPKPGAEPVFPTLDAQGFRIRGGGKGYHRLKLLFVARWQSGADYQELRFGIPRLPQSRLQLTMPAAWRDVKLPHCEGDSEVRGAANNQQTLRAELGRENLIQVRWRQDAAQAPAPVVELRELYLWDLRPAHFSVAGLLQYQVAKGSVSQLRVSIPDSLELVSVELGGQSASGARLSKWRLDPGRVLFIDLASPVSGKLQVVLNLVPRLALDAPLFPLGKLRDMHGVQLRLPVPLNVGKLQEGALAYRLEGFKPTDNAQRLAITSMAAEQFARDWSSAGQREPGPLTRAYSFRRTAGTGLSQLQVALQPIHPVLRQETVCQVQPLFTDVSVRIKAQGSKEVPVTHLRCEVPAAMVLADVTGPNVHHWSRTEGLLYAKNTGAPRDMDIVDVWFSNPAAEADVMLTGWVRNNTPQIGDRTGRVLIPRIAASAVRPPAGPPLRPLPPTPINGTVKIQPGAGCLVEPDGGPQTDPHLTQPSVLTYQAPGPSAFLIRPAPPRPEVRMLTTVSLGNGLFSFSTRVDCLLLREIPPAASKSARQRRQLVLTLSDWPADVRLDPLQPEVHSVYRRDGDEHTWTITLPAAQLRPLSVQMHGQMPTVPKQKIGVPVMEVADAVYRGRFLTWSGPELKPQTRGLLPVKDIGKIQRYWPAELGRLPGDSMLWQVKDTGWEFRVQAPATAAAAAWHLLWAEHHIHHQEGRWLHQADCFIAASSAAEVPVVLPEGARFQAACWGEHCINPRLDDPRHLTLQLPPEPAGQILRLRWVYPASAEQPAADVNHPRFGERRPRLDVPNFLLPPSSQPQGDADQPAMPTVLWLPADLSTASTPQGLACDPLLGRARAQMILCTLLAEGALEQKTPLPEKKIHAAQIQFQQLTRQAEQDMLTLARIHPDLDQNAQRVLLQDLRRQNKARAARGKYDQLREKAEKEGMLADLPQPLLALSLPSDGSPLRGFVAGDLPLRPAGKTDLAFAVFSSQLLLVGCFALFFLSFLSSLFWAVPALWPEQLLVIGILGTLLLGFSLLGALLLTTAILGRSIWLGRFLWLRAARLLHGTAPPAR